MHDRRFWGIVPEFMQCRRSRYGLSATNIRVGENQSQFIDIQGRLGTLTHRCCSLINSHDEVNPDSWTRRGQPVGVWNPVEAVQHNQWWQTIISLRLRHRNEGSITRWGFLYHHARRKLAKLEHTESGVQFLQWRWRCASWARREESVGGQTSMDFAFYPQILFQCTSLALWERRRLTIRKEISCGWTYTFPVHDSWPPFHKATSLTRFEGCLHKAPGERHFFYPPTCMGDWPRGTNTQLKKTAYLPLPKSSK